MTLWRKRIIANKCWCYECNKDMTLVQDGTSFQIPYDGTHTLVCPECKTKQCSKYANHSNTCEVSNDN